MIGLLAPVFAFALVIPQGPLAPMRLQSATRMPMCQAVVLSEETSTLSEAETLIMQADSPEGLILDLLKTMEEKSSIIATVLAQTEELMLTQTELVASVDEKESIMEEVVAELTTAREELDAAELVMNDLNKARDEIVSLKEELATVKGEKVVLQEAKIELQSKLDAALLNAKEDQEALQAALARIDDLVAKKGLSMSIPGAKLLGTVMSAAKSAVKGLAASGKTAAPKEDGPNDPAELVGKRVVVQGFQAGKLNGQQGLVTQWIVSDGRCAVRLDSSDLSTPPIALKPSLLKRI